MDVGKPYIWAQNICGLDFLNPTTPDFINSRNHIAQVLKSINNRLKTRLSLITQLDCSGKKLKLYKYTIVHFCIHMVIFN